MDIFRGKKKGKVTRKKFSPNVRISKNQVTKIPDRVLGIDDYPAVLKKGRVPLTEENVETTFRKFLTQHRSLFKVRSRDLKLVSRKRVNRRWYVKYGQYYKGIPVHDTTVSLESSEDGMVQSYLSNYQPGIEVPTKAKIKLKKAVAKAKKTYPREDSKGLTEREGSLIVYPEEKNGKPVHHLAWKFLLSGDQNNPETEKYFFVDAMNGKIIRSYSARFPGAQVSGTVQGEIYPANPTDSIDTMPIRHAAVDVNWAGSTTTNLSGAYAEHVPWWWDLLNFKRVTFKLDGPYAQVQNHDGTNYSETKEFDMSSHCDLTWTASDRDHINLFYHMNLFHDWLKNELGYSWVNLDGTNKFRAQVNYTYSNAYAGNPMTFGTDNFARSSDVIYHECTHNILHHEYGDYIGWPDDHTEAYAMDEGFADYFSCSFTNSSMQGEGCFSSPRNLQNTDQYPGKSSYHIEGHTGGLIIAGAAWDLRQRLVSYHGNQGARIADQLLLEAHQILSTYPRRYYFSDPNESNFLSALYRAADIDNDLLNGFPYFIDIQQAFSAHDLLQATLHDGDSFDFSTNTIGNFTGGDLYYYEGQFWANNFQQEGVVSLGNIGNTALSDAEIPTSGYTRFGVGAVRDHTYVSKAQDGETGGIIVFQVTEISADQSRVALRYLYRFNPNEYMANLNSKEIHKLDCHWVSLMSAANKRHCNDLGEVNDLIKDSRYNGCHYCLPRYDTDTLSIAQVHQNLDDDLGA